jgi:hypothetical protein
MGHIVVNSRGASYLQVKEYLSLDPDDSNVSTLLSVFISWQVDLDSCFKQNCSTVVEPSD